MRVHFVEGWRAAARWEGREGRMQQLATGTPEPQSRGAHKVKEASGRQTLPRAKTAEGMMDGEYLVLN